MRKVFLILILTASAPVCDSIASRGAVTVKSGPKTSPQSCSAPLGWQDVVARQPRYVVFGEVHGTREVPAFLANLACAIAANGERVLVAVEQEAEDNAALQAAWRAPSGTFEHALRGVGWEGRLDGIGSEAMFAMLMRLHEMKDRGRKIDVVAFNGFSDDAQRERFAHLPGQGPHEAAQAENISNAAAADEYNHVLVLVGNFHARKSTIDNGVSRFDPMAKRLELYGRTISFNMRFAAGSAWVCQAKPGMHPKVGQPIPRDAIACGVFPLGGSKNLNRAPYIQLGSFPEEELTNEYDGFAWVGGVSGSPPLLR